MSGGGGSYPPSRNIESLQERARAEAQQQALIAEVNALLAEKLGEINSRDTDAIGTYLDDITDRLSEQVDDVTQLLFGGSVAKHTYVDGLSDVDALVIVKKEVDTPKALIAEFADALRKGLPKNDVVDVSVGRMAVTVLYRDETEIQLLPAARVGDDVAVASADGKDWRTINPGRFARALSRINQSQGQLVIPTIKLAKSILGGAEKPVLSGYHVEALAVAAFKDYAGPRNLKSTVQHFFESAAKLVLKPIADTTRQSSHIDADLGSADSVPRRTVSRELRRLAFLMENAPSVDRWRDLIGD